MMVKTKKTIVTDNSQVIFYTLKRKCPAADFRMVSLLNIELLVSSATAKHPRS
jgi:hypothetical protein